MRKNQIAPYELTDRQKAILKGNSTPPAIRALLARKYDDIADRIIANTAAAALLRSEIDLALSAQEHEEVHDKALTLELTQQMLEAASRRIASYERQDNVRRAMELDAKVQPALAVHSGND